MEGSGDKKRKADLGRKGGGDSVGCGVCGSYQGP